MKRAPHPSRLAPRPRSRFVALVLALAFLVSAVFGGTVFVWCAPMAAAMLHACCPPQAHTERAFEQPCCEGHRVAALPDFSAAELPSPFIPPAPLLAVLALAILFAVAAMFDRPPPRLRAHPARAGPRLPLYLRHRSLLR